MNNEKYNQIIDEAYENYSKTPVDYITFSERNKHFKSDGLEFNSGYPNYIHFTQEEFINKCKTDSEFSEKWGLKIEERELSLEERYDLIEKDKHKQFVTWQSHGTNRIKEVIDEQGVPTKLITVTYKDERIEIYEN